MVISVDLWQQAARRWRERSTEREKQRVETTEKTRPRLRVGRLTRAAATEKAKALALAAEKTGRTAASTVNNFSLERILGKSDLVDANFLELAIAVGRPVARIHLRDGFGTGFLISPRLIMTNHHVIGDEQEAASAQAEFDYQQNATGDLLAVQSFRLEPQRFFLSSAELDFTIVAVAPQSDRQVPLERYGWVRLIADQGKADSGDCINIIQHPNGGLKQIALRENEVVDIFDNYLHYLTDTEPGSSGSPCFNDQWELVALHHSGVPKTDAAGHLLRDDGGVWRNGIDSPARLAWVANEGVRVSSIVGALNAAQMGPEQERMIDELLKAAPPNPIELAREANNGGKPATAAVMAETGNSITFSIPIQVTISLGQTAVVGSPAAADRQPAPARVDVAAPLAMAAAAGASTTSVVEPTEKVVIDPNYANRSGYNPDFMADFKVPLPQMSAAMVKNASQKLDYEHFSLVINKRRRIAYFTAVNIDGTEQQNIGKRQEDAWFFDERLDRKYQIGGDAYAGNALDQGHLVRRLDPVWGPTKEIAVRANNDSFHFTNCSPQHKTFNRGGDLWQGLENYLLDKAQKDERKLVVFTGPVLRANDPTYKSDHMDAPIRIPLEFWKVAALVKQDGSKAVAAFLVSQADLVGDAADLQEKFAPQTFQTSVNEIEKLTGLKFAAALHQFDTAAEHGALEKFEGLEAAVRPVHTLDEIRL